LPLALLEAPQNGALVNYLLASSGLLVLSLLLTYLLSGYLPHSVGALGIDRTPTRENSASCSSPRRTAFWWSTRSAASC